MWTLIVGLIVTFGSVLLSADTGSAQVFLNKHSLLVVVGGTLGVLLFTSPPSVLRTLAKGIYFLFTRERQIEDYDDVFKELEKRRQLSQPSSNELINAAVTLWESGVGSDSFLVLLDRRRIELEQRYQDAIVALRNLSKYPPAFGMTGTVYGLTTLFAQLNSDNRTGIGPALAFAMTATFLGLMVANGIVSPAADRMQIVVSARRRLYQDTYRRIVLIHQGESLNILDQVETESSRNAA